MAGKMNVNLFRVSASTGLPPLEEVLEQLVGQSYEDRLRRVGTYNMRLEHIAPPHSPGNTSDYWMLDFVKLREQGPGRAGRNTPIEDFEMNDEHAFGEETAALYDPATRYMLVQYNHHGVRAPGIQEYFNQVQHNPDGLSSYFLRIKLDESSEVRLARKQHISKVHFKIDASKMSAAFRNADVGLARALELTEMQDGQTLEITINAGRGRNLRRGPIQSLINTLLGVRADDEANDNGSLRQFEIQGREDELGRQEAINMLSPKLETTISDLSTGNGRRYTLLSRWIGLQRARRGWAHIIDG